MGDQNRTTPTNAFIDFSPLLANATQRLRQAEGEGSPPAAIFLPGAQAVDQGPRPLGRSFSYPVPLTNDQASRERGADNAIKFKELLAAARVRVQNREGMPHEASCVHICESYLGPYLRRGPSFPV
eukprot:scaffold47917_cov264-Isochrysis_galbana.AAC.1